MTGHGITYATREGITPAQERATLAEVFAFVIGCHQKKGTAAAGDPETINGTVFEGDSADARSIPEEG